MPHTRPLHAPIAEEVHHLAELRRLPPVADDEPLGITGMLVTRGRNPTSLSALARRNTADTPSQKGRTGLTMKYPSSPAADTSA